MMDFRLIKMQVLSMNFHEEHEEVEGDSKKASMLKIDAAMEASIDSPAYARMVISIELNAPGRYNLDGKIAFIFKFKEKTSEEELEKMLLEADTERLLYPYINTYLTNFIMGAGYARPGIPLILK
ncbi:hypothetical protein ACMGGS_12260 [Superficieibacter sp. BNK-5]|uniref:hypothetical protein n=1 Tax=Superficieibacter sp. BNK-5 TaxID=3376142 RepID=UPI0039BEFA86